MKSFIDTDRTFSGQPARLGVLLHRVDVCRGREELFTDQLPELLRSLAQSARIASIRASNAIEGVEVATDRAVGLAGGGRFRNRNEREFAGYRDAVDELMHARAEPISVPLILHLHRRVFQHVGGREGHFKAQDNQIVSFETGRRRVIFRPVSARETPFMTTELVERYLDAQTRAIAHPLILLCALVLDLLAIHPVADGNGRLARLTTTHELLRLGYGAPRYVSLEQQVFETKNSYYASLYDPSATGMRLSTRSGPGPSTWSRRSPRPMTASRTGSPRSGEREAPASRSGSALSSSSRRRRASPSATSAERYRVPATRRSAWSSTT